MSIKSIKVNNLLSFDELVIRDFSDVNCIIGQNNVGKSNLLKIIKYFYEKLDGKKTLPPSLYSNYSSFGAITILYDTERIKKIVTSTKNNKSYFLKHIYNTLFRKEVKVGQNFNFKELFLYFPDSKKDNTYELTLKINSDDSTEWSTKNKEILRILNYLFPFFDVEARGIQLHDWENLWFIISKLQSFNIKGIENKEVVDFIDSNISENSKSYKNYINKIEGLIDVSKYSYREKVLNYIKVGLEGHTFVVSGEDLRVQSDGTNSYYYIELLLSLLISLTRREYISPTVYIDEPELGLHPKKSEELIYNLHTVYSSFKKTKEIKEIGRYETPYPKILFSTHSPNILKYVIKLFGNSQQVLHFSKLSNGATRVKKMNSQYEDKRFYNIFSDNEARLFFSNFILFVEGATELEVFSNISLLRFFPEMKSIDVFQANNLTLKYTNPSYINLSIPYLILYDADKLIKYDVSTEVISYWNNNIDLDKIKTNAQRSYYGSHGFFKKKYVGDVVDRQGHLVPCDHRKLSFSGKKSNFDIKKINDVLLKPNSYYLVSTTIEGALINVNSVQLFNRWLNYELKNNFNFRYSKDPAKLIASQEQRYNNNKQTIGEIFGLLFMYEGVVNKFPEDKISFLSMIKRDYIKSIKLSIRSKVNSTEDLVTVYRLVFNGKTDTLVSMENSQYNSIDATFRGIVSDIKNENFRAFEPIMGKTGGWVTRFLNYSIKDIERKSTGRRKRFQFYFPELYDIVKIASSSIE